MDNPLGLEAVGIVAAKVRPLTEGTKTWREEFCPANIEAGVDCPMKVNDPKFATIRSCVPLPKISPVAMPRGLVPAARVRGVGWERASAKRTAGAKRGRN